MADVFQALRMLGDRTWLSLGRCQGAYEEATSRLVSTMACERVARRDSSWWSPDPDVRADIADRLGWLDLPAAMTELIPTVAMMATEVRKEGLDKVLLLGMGGSSLAAEVMSETLQPASASVELTVLDSTDADQIRAVAHGLDVRRTLFVVASKSGTTIETQTLADYFRSCVAATAGTEWPRRFVVVTDPGTPLDRWATTHGVRANFRSAWDFGGRYSALSLYGIVPAALMGADLVQLLAGGERMARRCLDCSSAADNPGLILGAVMGGLAAAPAGHDKLTLLLSPRLRALGPWIEQLVAESTGKAGTGILPVEGEPWLPPHRYSHDRLFCYVRLAGDHNEELDAHVVALASSGRPVVALGCPSLASLGGEFFRWEFATAIAGGLLGINPFDQPNVESAKRRAVALLERQQGPEDLAAETVLRCHDLTMPRAPVGASTFCNGLASLVSVEPRGYIAVMAYLPRSADIDVRLAMLRRRLLETSGVPVTVGYGPRFLHSTGQIHKGGPAGGAFLQITHDPAADLEIPGKSYTFAGLQRAQADGDLAALLENSRRAARIHITGDVLEGLDALTRAVFKVSSGA